MLIGSLVEVVCWIEFMSVFFTSRKSSFKSYLDTSSIPPWYLAVCRASSAFSYRNPDSFSTPGGSIEKVPASSIASRHLVDRSSFCSCIWWFVPWHLLDTLLSVELLQLFLIAILTVAQYLVDRSSFYSSFCWVVPRHLLNTCICRRPFPRHLSRQMSWYLSISSSVEIYWGSI